MAEADAPRVAGSSRHCVSASSGGPGIVRSGDFSVGPFGHYAAIWHSGQGKLWWQPAKIDSVAGLQVEARRLDRSGVSKTYSYHSIARAIDAYGPFDRRGMSLFSPPFFPTDMRLPTTGDWLLVARNGRNWACVLFRLD